MSHYNESPVNPLPTVVIALCLALALPEIVFRVGENGLIGGPTGVGWRINAVERFGFFNSVFDQMVTLRHWPVEHLIRFVTYIFVSFDFVGLVFSLVFLLALGKMVGEQFSTLAVLVVYFGSAIFGALIFGLVMNSQYPLIGAMVPAFGLIGAYTFLYWIKQVATGGPQRQAFGLIGFLMALQLGFGLIFGSNGGWVAELAAFVAGFGLSFLVVPGGFARIRTWMRNR